MEFMKDLRIRAAAAKRTIVLPEGDEPRTVKAAKQITCEGIANVILVGNADKIRETAVSTGTDITGIKIVDPLESPHLQDYAKEFYEIRKDKGMDENRALETMKDQMYFDGA